jgi:hypothetical protein
VDRFHTMIDTLGKGINDYIKSEESQSG